MTTPFRIGIVGAGAIATYGHIPGFQAAPGTEVVAICDTNLERAQAAASKFNIPKAYSDYRDMIAAGNLDAISVGVPNALHAPVALAGLEAGLNVFCEKPMATSVADGEAMVAAAKKAGKVLAINMSNRPRPEVLYMRQAVSDGRLGKVSYAYGRLIRRTGIPGFGSWFTRRELSGGGALMDIGVHMLDMVMFALGFPKVAAVRGEAQMVHGPQGRGLGGWGMDRVPGGTFDVDDLAAIHLRLADGGIVTIEVTWAFYGRNEERIQIAGSEAGLDFFPALYGEDHPLRMYKDDAGGPVEIIPTLHKPDQRVWTLGLTRFVEACRGEGQPVASGEDGLQILKLLDATNRSAAEGREVTL
ncbi:MAG TPA: Gfo/Idh/MocA family oxidoreductase [Roseiflexaceae bacterium]|nr:Gfo/Idh/MocA family oxidoreductase [Roseiflexaceae bacterium]